MPKEFINIYGKIVRDDCISKEICQIGSCKDCHKESTLARTQGVNRNIPEQSTADILIRLHETTIEEIKSLKNTIRTVLDGLRLLHTSTIFEELFHCLDQTLEDETGWMIDEEQDLIASARGIPAAEPDRQHHNYEYAYEYNEDEEEDDD